MTYLSNTLWKSETERRFLFRFLRVDSNGSVCFPTAARRADDGGEGR